MASNPCLDPKSEYKEDPEIDKIAEQIKVANAKKMIQLQNPIQLQIKQPAQVTIAEKPETTDWQSVQGQFGWIEIGSEVIPYLMRDGVKIVSHRMTRLKVFQQFYSVFKEEIWEYLPITVQYATAAEANLLNEINKDHCDNSYGTNPFTPSDQIYPLQDAINLFEFITFSYTKLTRNIFTENQRCGFIKIDKSNLVPYVQVNNMKYVPLFYFEGASDHLEKTAVPLTGWDLTYLKLTCKIQGIRRPLYDKDMIEVVDFEYLKKFFPPNTEFEIGWSGEANPFVLIKPVEIRKMVNQQNNPQKKAPAVVANRQGPSNVEHLQKSYPTNANSVQNVHPGHQLPGQIPAMTARAVRNRRPSSKCYQIPEVDISNPYQYFLTNVNFRGKNLNFCVNMEPNNSSNLLVTLEELAFSTFQVEMKKIKQALCDLDFDIYRPNRGQLLALNTANLVSTEGLISVVRLNQLFQRFETILKSL